MRQTEALYKQIGINPSANITERELEEYIILKAIRDYNHSKFPQSEQVIIEGIIRDVFSNNTRVKNLEKPIQDYGALKELVVQSFADQRLDYSRGQEIKAYQLYEISQVKSGCIILGESQAGKTTLVKLLEGALNKAMVNELKIRVAEARKQRLWKIAQETNYGMTLIEAKQKNKPVEEKPKETNEGFGGSDMSKKKRIKAPGKITDK